MKKNMFELEQVSKSIWAHTLGETIGNVAVIKLTESNVVVDSGMMVETMCLLV